MSTLAVAYAGRDGAHAAAACERAVPRAGSVVPLPSFSAVVGAAARGRASSACFRSRARCPARRRDARPAPASALSIAGETILRIRHCLLGPEDVPLEQIPDRALAPGRARPVPAAARGDALGDRDRLGRRPRRRRRDRRAGRPEQAAIAASGRGFRPAVLADDVGDHPEAYTRFVSVRSTRLDRTPRSWRTAFSFVTDHRPGALHRAIEPFAPPRNRPRAARLAADPATRRGGTASTRCSPATRSTSRSGAP